MFAKTSNKAYKVGIMPELYMELPSNIQFIDNKLKAKFDEMKKYNPQGELFKQLSKATGEIEKNAFCGIQIPKRLIPKPDYSKYNLKNLWKYNLTGGWRLLYSIETNGLIVTTIIIELLNHKDYEKKFKY